jgi:hypothetical protein
MPAARGRRRLFINIKFCGGPFAKAVRGKLWPGYRLKFQEELERRRT